jgi:hypothetical protein
MTPETFHSSAAVAQRLRLQRGPSVGDWPAEINATLWKHSLILWIISGKRFLYSAGDSLVSRTKITECAAVFITGISSDMIE